MNDADLEFVQRTQHIINNYKEKYDFTLLLNCTLGLIILPLEVNRKQKLNFLNGNLDDIDVIKSILQNDPEHIFKPTKRNLKTNKYEETSKTLLNFLYKIRNSIAHFANSKPINEGGIWTKIKLKDINKFNKGNIELELTISEKDLKNLAQYLSDEYLKEMKNIRKLE
jgi:hypothetical protein